MAGAGTRLFVDGQILTAAQVNTYLQDQVIMRFANAATRDAAFGGVGEPTLAEGMFCYLDDLNLLQTYTGSAWKTLASSGFTNGGVIQVVHGSYGIGVTNNTNVEVDTGLTATITPTSTTSKIFVMINQQGVAKEAGNAATSVGITTYRNTTPIHYMNGFLYQNVSQLHIDSWDLQILDSPATTSAVTYKTRFYNSGGNVAGVNVQRSIGAGWQDSRITLMEIAS